MEHFIRIAFWIAALAACLRGNPVPLIQIKDWNTELLKSVDCDDSTMYSPTDVTEDCFISALDCIMAELQGRVYAECDDPNERIPRVLNTLNDAISTMKEKSNQVVNNSPECDCHKWPVQRFDRFANDVESLLQKINTKF